MPVKIEPAESSEISLPELAGGLRYVARQPILDQRGRVHGYELLFRAGPEAAFRGDGDMATRTMLDNLHGIRRCSTQMLLGGWRRSQMNDTIRTAIITFVLLVLPFGRSIGESLKARNVKIDNVPFAWPTSTVTA